MNNLLFSKYTHAQNVEHLGQCGKVSIVWKTNCSEGKHATNNSSEPLCFGLDGIANLLTPKEFTTVFYLNLYVEFQTPILYELYFCIIDYLIIPPVMLLIRI